MAKLVNVFSVLNQTYEDGLIRFFQAGEGSKPWDVQVPHDTGLTDIVGAKEHDAVVLCYMNGALPRALVSVIVTNFTTGKSIARYYVCIPNLETDPITWTRLGEEDGIRLFDDDGPIATNPYGLAQVDGYMCIADYDSSKIGRFNIPGFETAVIDENASYTATDVFDVTDNLYTPPAGAVLHGVSVVSLFDGTDKWIFALFNVVEENEEHMPVTYYPSILARVKVDASGFVQGSAGIVTVGKNATGLTIAFPGTGEIIIIISCMGGYQNNGKTNGPDSVLCKVSAFGSGFSAAAPFPAAPVALKGDENPTTAAEDPELSMLQNYDIRGVLCYDGGLVYVFVGTYGLNYTFWWRVFKTHLTGLLNSDDKTLAEAVAGPDFEEVDSGVASPGNYMEIAAENSTRRIWTVLGSSFRVSEADHYKHHVLFDEGIVYGESVISDPNINSACMLGEMIETYKLGHSLDYRMFKNRHLAKIAAARMAAARAASKEQ
jgi:hypothetical protein